jgi:hypothetical protein
MTVGSVKKAIDEYIRRAKEQNREVTPEEIKQVAEAALSETTWNDRDLFSR